MTDRGTPRLARIAVHPIKSLEPIERDQATITANGALEHDREYAMMDGDGQYVNGKRTPAVHQIRSSFDEAIESVSLRPYGSPTETAHTLRLNGDRASADAGLSDYFGFPVHLQRDTNGGFPDDTVRSGPTLISTGTIREVASWFDGLDEQQIRLRFRANLEIDGVPPFWEDRLFSDHEHTVAVRIGEVTLQGANPCQRCIVPVRDPYTGEEYDGFQRTFVENRDRTFPEWADRSRFDHYFRLMVNTRVHEPE